MEGSTKRWVVRPRPPREAASSLKVPPLVAHLLYHRGVRDASDVEAFLATGPHHLHDPFLMPGMRDAVRRLHRAIASGERVAVFGDFDVDGVTGTVLLARALEGLGAQVLPYIPHRVREGHGLSALAVRELKAQGAYLLVTVDCGITSKREVAEANALGMDVVITDHHALPDSPPAAHAIVSPLLEGSQYPFRELSGAGLALKLTQGLYQWAGCKWDTGLLGLAALGTVADLSPLLGENRLIVKEGLRIICRTPSPGVSEMCRLAGIEAKAVDTEAISYIIAPRLNAPGRLEHALTSYRLLATTSVEEATALAAEVEVLNRRRQQMTDEALQVARQEVLSRGTLPPLLFVAREEFNPGINGLVASKLVEEFYHPAVVVSVGEVARGSARSIPEFDVGDALARCRDLLHRFGGHPRAAGFVADCARLAELERQLVLVAGLRLAGHDFSPCIVADADVAPGQLNGDLIRWLRRLEPFGEGNPEPIFIGRGVEVLRAWPMGEDGRHLRMTVRSKGTTWDAVGFDLANRLPEASSTVDLVYSLGTDFWGGQEVMSLRVLDISASHAGR